MEVISSTDNVQMPVSDWMQQLH